MTAERIATQQDDVDEEDEGADADAELPATRPVKPQRPPGVVGQEQEKKEGQVKGNAVDVLQDQGKGALTPIALAGFADGTGRWIGPEGLVVSAAVVVAGEPKARRRPQDEERRRKWKPSG